MDSLFPQQQSATAAARQSAALISFKAGKCVVSERQSNGKFSVVPDKRRGTLSMSKSSDGLMHFRWTDRTTGNLEDHRIVFPNEVNFKKCRTGRETDRVYVLKFTHSQQPMMFWMQEKSPEKDTENVAKVNEYANNPAAADAAAAAIASAAAAASAPAPGSMTERLAQLMGLPAGAPSDSASSTSIAASAGAQSFGNLDLSSLLGTSATPANTRGGLTSEDLQRAMSGINNSGMSREANRTAGLEDILSSEAVLATGILNDPAVRQALIEQLPEGQRSEEHLEESLRSPQFRQSLGQLSGALQSENINGVMANFNIDPAPGMDHLVRGDGVGAFISALQADVDSTVAATSTSTAENVPGNNNSDSKEDDSKMDEA